MSRNFKKLLVPINKFVNYAVEKLFSIVKAANLCNATNAEFAQLGIN
jgi:hypothetical protein